MKIKKLFQFNADHLFYSILLIWYFLFLWPLTYSSFISDDAYNSQIHGILIDKDISLYEHILNSLKEWLSQSGRFLFSFIYVFPLYYFVSSTFVIKIINILLITFSACLYYFYLKTIKNSPELSKVIVLFLPIFFQFREWHDPILAFTFLLPMVFILGITSLIFYEKFLKTGTKNLYLISTLSYTLSFLFYEVGIIFLIIIFIKEFFEKNLSFKEIFIRNRLKIIITLLIILISIYFRLFGKNYDPYLGSVLNLNFINFAKAFFIQLASAIPLSYSLINMNLSNLFIGLKITDVLNFLFFFFVTLFTLRFILQINHSLLIKNLINISLSLFILPAFIIALSGHQQELIVAGFGYGYIVLFIQYFGLSGLIVIGIYKLFQFTNKNIIIYLIISIFLSLILFITYFSNNKVIEETNKFYMYPKNLISNALTNDDIKMKLSSSTYIFRVMNYPSDYKWSYMSLLKKKINICDLNKKHDNECVENILIDNKLEKKLLIFPDNNFHKIIFYEDQIFLTYYENNFETKKSNNNIFLVTPIKEMIIKSQNNSLVEAFSDHFYIYDSSLNKTIPLKTNNQIKLSDNNLNQLLNNHTPKNDSFVINWFGNYPMDGDSKNNVRWSKRKSYFEVLNTSLSSEISLNFNFLLNVPSNDFKFFEVFIGNKKEIIKIKSHITPINKKIIIKPGRSVRVSFNYKGDKISNGDPRDIYFGYNNFNINLE